VDPLTWRDLVLTGARIDAANAVKSRLIDSAVDEKKLLPSSLELAAKLARMLFTTTLLHIVHKITIMSLSFVVCFHIHVM
jgi:enoyl-CoA hydratase/carnithine racemase